VALGVGLLGIRGTVDIIAIAAEAAFLVFFVRHFFFTISALRSAPGDISAPVLDTGHRPTISVLVACRNEEAVVDRLVRSLLSLEYPKDKLQLIVVDDGSSDRTGDLLDRYASGGRLSCLHRPPGSPGGKAGALNAALDQVRGEIVVVFDADHAPHSDVLRRLVRHFEDPGVAAAQGRCEVRNAESSPLARLVAIDYLAGYLVNEYGRQSVFRLPAYGGANCAVRARVLRELGGWNTATVTEDTDLTLRLLLAGKRVRFDVSAVDEEEGVVTLQRYWRQRYRWARGHQQAWRDYRGAVWRSQVLSLPDKVETTLFLLAFHLPIVTAVGIGVVAAWLAGLGSPPVPFDFFVFWTLLFLGPILELGAGLLLGKSDRRWAFSLVYFLPLFLVSSALCSKAWLDGVLGRPYSWVKTRRAAEVD
jgi:cellulose synthase/poly-beta-1,6-N-acetylglucosamine synthase-like glycosyltransferase